MPMSRMVVKIALTSLLMLVGHDGIMAMNPHEAGHSMESGGIYAGMQHVDEQTHLSTRCAAPDGRVDSSNLTPETTEQGNVPIINNSISAPDLAVRIQSEGPRAIDSSSLRVLWQVFLN